MRVDLYFSVHRRYTSLAIIGPILDGYGMWLLKQRYSTERAPEHALPCGTVRSVAGLCSHRFAGGSRLGGTGVPRKSSWVCVTHCCITRYTDFEQSST